MFAYAEPKQKIAVKSVVQKKEAENKVLASNMSELPKNQWSFSFSDTQRNRVSDEPVQFHALRFSQGNQVYINNITQMKSYATEARSINDYARSQIPFAGNRTDDVLNSGGKSYAGVGLIDFLIRKEHIESWENRENLAKRATLAVDLKAANCNQYAALAYSRALKLTDADVVALEYDSSHAYVAVYDNEENTQPGEQTIIDPWVKHAGLRKHLQEYYKDRYNNQKAKLKADHKNWYYPNYTDGLLAKYTKESLDKYETDMKAEGLDKARIAKQQGVDYF